MDFHSISSPLYSSTTHSTSASILEKHLIEHQLLIESWLRKQWQLTPPPFYCSVDLRNAGYKIAPVDTNLFPAGFNNLKPDFWPLCIQAIQATVQEICPHVNEILLIPENHTRNLYYLENVACLQELLLKAGFIVKIGSLLPDLTVPTQIDLSSDKKIILEPLLRVDDKVGVANFFPCLILLNNDLAAGVPSILQNLKQVIMPPLDLGWATRLKSVHFHHYQKIVTELSQQIDLDPWLISPLFRNCGEVDFMNHVGEKCLVTHATELLAEIRQKYAEYQITDQPFLVVKADAGTYGMAVMMIHEANELQHLNHKQRTQMTKTKGGKPVTKVIIQEGVYTVETSSENHTAEPVVYMIGRHVISGFYRVHTQRSASENLNSPGMHFEPLAFEQACNNPTLECNTAHIANHFYSYGVIARLALLAAARELAVINPPQKAK